MNVWLAIFLGGGIGSLMRFGITRLFLALDVRSAFPWATLATNVLAALILAVLVLRLAHPLQERPALRAFLAVGICGGFSTFSTFSYETFLLLREGLVMQAAINAIVSTFACLLVFFLIARTA